MNPNKRSLGAKTLLYPLPALLVGSYDDQGRPNLMLAAWGGICNSEPPCLSVSIRPGRHTHAAIMARQAFTVGIPSRKIIAEADYTGIASGKKNDKFKVTGLTPVRAEKVEAPYAAECPVVAECRLHRTLELGSHTLIVGEILDVKADEDILAPGGNYPDLAKFEPVGFDAGSRAYYLIGPQAGLAFKDGRKFL